MFSNCTEGRLRLRGWRCGIAVHSPATASLIWSFPALSWRSMVPSSLLLILQDPSYPSPALCGPTRMHPASLPDSGSYLTGLCVCLSPGICWDSVVLSQPSSPPLCSSLLLPKPCPNICWDLPFPRLEVHTSSRCAHFTVYSAILHFYLIQSPQ